MSVKTEPGIASSTSSPTADTATEERDLTFHSSSRADVITVFGKPDANGVSKGYNFSPSWASPFHELMKTMARSCRLERAAEMKVMAMPPQFSSSSSSASPASAPAMADIDVKEASTTTTPTQVLSEVKEVVAIQQPVQAASAPVPAQGMPTPPLSSTSVTQQVANKPGESAPAFATPTTAAPQANAPTAAATEPPPTVQAKVMTVEPKTGPESNPPSAATPAAIAPGSSDTPDVNTMCVQDLVIYAYNQGWIQAIHKQKHKQATDIINGKLAQMKKDPSEQARKVTQTAVTKARQRLEHHH
jgi:hypothetical protein